ncbi:AAA family ATPase [Alcaligenes sp. WGS1538]|uniref:AAA family ATPase n=1 Tax=Alcaligenes sp. WGS1538 TaxID=3366811 RepID=UPI00372D6D34
MHVKSLRVEQFKRFREPVRLDQLDPGLNIISAPNEAGKSTLAQALRTVFFERYSTSSLNDILPWGDSSAAPAVELEFSMNGQDMRLSKRFLKRKRCDLLIGREQLDNDEAEQYLASRMGFEYAARGGSQARNWGVPGLLWIEQGQGQELRAAVQHAGATLQQALGTEMSDLTSADGDYVLDQAQQQLDQYVTQAQGQPRGVWLAARRERDELQADLERLESDLRQYRQWVDELAQARHQVADGERDRPWERLRAQARAATEQLKQARELQARSLELKQQLDMLQERERLYQQAREQDGALAAQRQDRLAQAEALKAELLNARSGLLALESRLQQARSHKDRMRQEQERARAWQQWAREQDAHASAQQQARQYQDQLDELSRHETELAECSAAVLRLRVEDEALAALRQHSQQVQRLQHQLESVATEMQVELEEGMHIQVDGKDIRGRARLQLTDSTQVLLPGFGRLRIVPGGKDLAGLAQQLEQAQREFRLALQEQGANSLEELEQRREQGRQQEQRESVLRASMRILAPKGKAHLQGLLAAARQSSPPVRPQGEPLEEADLERMVREASLAEQQWQALETEWRQGRESLATLAARHEQAQAEAQRVEQQWADPQRQSAERDRERLWSELRERREQLRRDQQTLLAQLERLPVDILEQDVERLERSARQQEQAYAQARVAAQLVQAKLETQGAQGLEEQIADVRARLLDSERRCAAYERRVAALRLLVQVLREQRRALTQQLHQPLQKHINHYLRLLLGKASVELDEHLAPRWLQREDGEPMADDIDGLSFGAREQIGLIARLAYADLLQQAGRPTLLILDDVLVHSDHDRLQAMKRIINDAARRHQILLFTCQADKWLDMGVPLRPVPRVQ